MSEIHSESKLAKIRQALRENPGRKLGGEYLLLPRAGVGVILRQDPQRGIGLLLLKRRTRESDQWSGHMAFPGGRMKETDEKMINTTKRETLEETGIDLDKCELLGDLDDLPPGNKSVIVTPFVFLAPENLEVEKIETSEIEDHVWIPLSFFINKNNSVGYKMQIESASQEIE